jgi:hypothetical protein
MMVHSAFRFFKVVFGWQVVKQSQTAVFRDFDDYWTPFLSGCDLRAPGYVISLDEDRRARLKERLWTSLPIGADGYIHLVARAWAVRGSTGRS